MTRFKRQPKPLIYAALVVSMVLVFLGDLYSPLGYATWVFYLIPVVLSFLLWRPEIPLGVAAFATVLTIAGYVLSPAGLHESVGRANRVFCFVTVWSLALIGRQFILTRLQVRRQEWLDGGQRMLSEKMVGDRQLKPLGEEVLRFLSGYLQAQAGAIFMEQNGGFGRFATYGVPHDAKVPEAFALGDGLLGQAAKDKRTWVIGEVPEAYLTIGSALGRGSPRYLLIAPACVDGEVKAVLELGFFHQVEESATELLKRTSESIAVAVRSAQYRARLQQLLEETQRQAEELQAQSEEMRVTNEELEEQSRALKESQARLEQQQAELEQNNLQLQHQTQTLESRNDELTNTKELLEVQTAQLAQASRYKSEFLANMSHELRTPLNSSLILAKLLADNRDGNLTSEQVKYARTIESAGQDLLALINDVLDLAKVEAGRMEVKPQPLVVSGLVENLRSTFQPLAEHKGLRLHTHVAAHTPQTLHTDPQRLEQVLKNLLSNAVKFTEQGEVALEVSPTNDHSVVFAVRDTGIGIPEHQQEVIFEPFCQADGTTNRKYGGTGLGLSISREFVRLLGGEIQVESAPGKGSIFRLTLPVIFEALREQAKPVFALADSAPPAAARPVMPPAPARPATAPVRHARVEDDREHISGQNRIILVVEDDETFARIIYDIAHELGFQGLIATSAEEALALAAQFLPSAVVLDVGLPDRSGLSVLERLKTDARTRHIPVHVVSASDYAQTALSLGAVGYMLKPVKREQLVEAFERLETRLTRKLRRVLIVEDDPAQRESLCRLLGAAEVETVAVSNAAECLEKLRNSTFDCMVLDLSLPDASGFALLETLSREDMYSFPPVIVYTGRELSPDEEQRLRKYSKSIIIKGAKSPERLLDEVTLFLHQVVSELPAEKQRMLEKARRRDAALDGRRILIVEDDVRNVFALTSVLEPHGVQVQIARNGREALDTLNQSSKPGQRPIDLVLMDLMMPEMDGLTATREIRNRSEWKKLPVIALTAKAMKDDQEQALAAGANDYMAKPLDVDKLLSLVRVWMPR